MSYNDADKRRFFEARNRAEKKCVEHGGANNPFQTSAPPAQIEDGESVSEAARSVYRLLCDVLRKINKQRTKRHDVAKSLKNL
jgi:hypothetical protein